MRACLGARDPSKVLDVGSIPTARSNNVDNLIECATIWTIESGSWARLRLPGVRVVLDNVNRKIHECYEHVEDCKRQADADPAARGDFLIIAEGWLVLARSYEFAERLTQPNAASSASK
jgi:hypothetical protein